MVRTDEWVKERFFSQRELDNKKASALPPRALLGWFACYLKKPP